MMIYAIISDIHANLEALEAALNDAASHGATEIVCLGDIVGYGPLPRETLRRVRETARIILAGNHDDAVSGRCNADGFIPLATEAVSRHRAALSTEELNALRDLPYTVAQDDMAFAHGDFSNPSAFNYIETPDSAAASFAATHAGILFVGHTHEPRVFRLGAIGTIESRPPQDFVREADTRYIVNVGSIGYPRTSDGICESSYVLYDTVSKSVKFRRLPFAVSSVMQRGVDTTATDRSNSRLKTWGCGALVAGLLVSAAILPSLRRAPAPVLVEATPINPVFAEQQLYFTPAKHAVRANVRLLRASAPAILVVSFEDDHQREIAAVTNLVVKSSTRKFAIPTNAVCARFALRTSVPGQIPNIDGFAPRAE